MSLIDSHCHLQSFVQKRSLDGVLSRARSAGVNRFITVGTNLDDWKSYQSLAHSNRDIFYSVGLHPCYVGRNWSKDVEKIPEYWDESTQPVAFGEIGLDYFHLPKDKIKAAEIVNQQKKCFSNQLEFASSLCCPIIIHSRNSFEDCVSLIDQSGLDWQRVVFHCFSEGKPQIQKLGDRGGRASFTGNITFAGNESILDAIRYQGIEKLMLETDSPYLCPEPNRKSKNEPFRLREILIFLNSYFDEKLHTLEELIKVNTEKFFKLSG